MHLFNFLAAGGKTRVPTPAGRFLLLAIACMPALAAAQALRTDLEYDTVDRLTKRTDGLGHATDLDYDPLKRPVQIRQPAPVAGAARPLVKLGYDGLDQLTGVTDPRALQTSYAIDGLGNLLTLGSPDTGTTQYTYDSAGNLLSRVDARNVTTNYTYDALNRLTSVKWPGGPKGAGAGAAANLYTYDQGANGSGHLTQLSDESGQTDFTYDQRGRLLGKKQTVTGSGAKSFSVAYAYGASGSANGHLASLTYPSGVRVNFAYDAAGRVSGVTYNGIGDPASITLLRDIGYNDAALVQGWTWGNSTATNVNIYTRTFDLNGRLVSYPLCRAADGVTRTLGYDDAGRILRMTHGGNAPAPDNLDQTFDYDALDRLTRFAATATTQSYQYDANGNRTQLTRDGVSYVNAIEPASNRLSGITGPATAKSYAYDAAGNLKSDGTTTFTFAANGRMHSVTNGSGTTTYLYNALGQRVLKLGATGIVGTDATYFVYDEAGRLLGEYDTAGNVIEETVYLDDQPIAVLKQDVVGVTIPTPLPPDDSLKKTATLAKATGTAPVPPTTVTTAYHVYGDHLNTARVIARASDNAVMWRWEGADPFGATAPVENPAGLGIFTYNPRLPGQYFDRESGLHYNYFRDYDAQTGRYIQSDPIGLKGGMNTYAYADGNPLSHKDPFGLAWECIRVGLVTTCRNTPPAGPMDPYEKFLEPKRSAWEMPNIFKPLPEPSKSEKDDKDYCISVCYPILERPKKGFWDDRNEIDFNKCVRDCMDARACPK